MHGPFYEYGQKQNCASCMSDLRPGEAAAMNSMDRQTGAKNYPVGGATFTMVTAGGAMVASLKP